MVHFWQTDLLATPVNYFLATAHQEKIAFVIQPADVAGAKPAIFGESSMVCFGIVKVSRHEHGSPYHDFAFSFRRLQAAQIVHDRYFPVEGPPHRAWSSQARRAARGGDHFRKAIAIQD